MSLSGFLRLFEAVEVSHATSLLARHVREEAGADVTEALLLARILRQAGVANSFACGAAEHDGCSRRIATDGVSRELPLVAACGRSPAQCDPLRLATSDCEELALSRRAFEDTLATLYGAELLGARSSGYGPLTKLGEANGSGPARDVFLAARAWDKGLPDALHHREHAARRTLVLVPTRTSVSSDLALAYPPGGRVEVAILEDVLELRDGLLALRDATPKGAKKPRKRRRAIGRLVRGVVIPQPKRWRDLSAYRVSDEMASLRVGRAHVRCVCTDLLGMAYPGSRAPTESWRLFILALRSDGWLRIGGQREAVKMRMSRLRKILCGVFGLSENPFEGYSNKNGWKTKFHAYASLPANLYD